LVIQETAKLAGESLKKLQKKRIDLLNDLKMTNKRITDEEISKLHAISNQVLTIEDPSLAPVQEQLQKYFQAHFYRKQAKTSVFRFQPSQKRLNSTIWIIFRRS